MPISILHNPVSRRRAFLAGGVAGLAAALGATPALADTRFVNFTFPATGTPTSRTMPARLAEIFNVKDWGAVGNAMADDTAPIQAAVNACDAAGGGTVYFPLSAYLITSSITYNGNNSIRFVGELQASLITCSFNGYALDRSPMTPSNATGGRIIERLSIINGGATGGCIRMGSTDGGIIRDCALSAHINITTEDSAGVSAKNICIEDILFSTRGTVAGSHHIIIGGNGAIQGCNIQAADVGVRAYGNGLYIGGNRAERNNTAFLLGLDSADVNAGMSGFAMVSGTTEGCWVSINLAGLCSGFVISSWALLGHPASNAGVTPNIMGTQNGIIIGADCAQGGMISGITMGQIIDDAGIKFGNATSRQNLTIANINSTPGPFSLGVGWSLPTTAQTAFFLPGNNVSPIWTFAGLPSGANVFEGDEFDISDSTTATWGNNVTTGGGSNRILVRWNGSNYTVLGQ